MILHFLVCATLIGLASAQGESVDIKVSDDGNNRVMVTGTGNEDHGIETGEPNGQQPQFERVGYTRDHYNFQPNQATVQCENCPNPEPMAPNNEQQRPPNMEEHRPIEQQRPNNEQQKQNMEEHRPMEQQRPNNEQQRPNMQEHRPVEQQRPNNEQQRPPNMEVHGPIEQQRPPNMEERRPNEPQRPNNEQQRPPNMEERRPMNEQQRPPNIEEHRPMNEQQRPNNEVLNRIDHREAAMYEMNQQQMHKMDSLDNKFTRFSTITQQQLDALRSDFRDFIRRIENINWISSQSDGRLQQLMSDMQYMRVAIETQNTGCTVNPFHPTSLNSLPSIESRLQSIAALLESTRSAINQLQFEFHRFEGAMPTVSITGMMPPFCPPGCIQYVTAGGYIPANMRQPSFDINYNMQPPPIMSINPIRPPLVPSNQPAIQTNTNTYVGFRPPRPPLLNITHPIMPPKLDQPVNHNPTKPPINHNPTKPPMNHNPKKPPIHPNNTNSLPQIAHHPSTPHQQKHTTTVKPPPAITVAQKITVVKTPSPAVTIHKPPVSPPKTTNTVRPPVHHNQTTPTQKPAHKKKPPQTINHVTKPPPNKVKQPQPLPHIVVTPPPLAHVVLSPPPVQNIVQQTRKPPLPPTRPPAHVQPMNPKNHLKPPPQTNNNIWTPIQNPSNEHPQENHPPENRPPMNRPPENHPPMNRPPENRPPMNRPPENRPPENRPPMNRPPPEMHPAEMHPPEMHPPELRPPEMAPMQPSPEWNGPPITPFAVPMLPVPAIPVAPATIPMEGGFVPSSPMEVTELDAGNFPTSCNDIPTTQSGAYQIKLNDGFTSPFFVYCEMKSPNNRWAVIMNRENGSIDFHRNWDDYRNGFGNLVNEFWMGLDNLYRMTANQMHELLIHLEDWDGNTKYARYSNFAIGNQDEGFPLRVLGPYDGTAGDSMTYHAGQKFSTYDQDNDGWPEGNCAKAHTGAWWYNSCDMCNLNGRYLGDAVVDNDPYQGIYWNDFRGPYYSLKRAKMMIRPVMPLPVV